MHTLLNYNYGGLAMSKQRIIQTYYDIDGGWMAIFDDYDGGMIDYETPSSEPIGHGCTEQEAIDDLLAM
jgi:hypothetical protein